MQYVSCSNPKLNFILTFLKLLFLLCNTTLWILTKFPSARRMRQISFFSELDKDQLHADACGKPWLIYIYSSTRERFSYIHYGLELFLLIWKKRWFFSEMNLTNMPVYYESTVLNDRVRSKFCQMSANVLSNAGRVGYCDIV